MAKMVKCPTCGTKIEVPAQPSGQIVKCSGCGKGLKLVAKKPAGQPPAAGAGAAAGAGGGSRSGTGEFRSPGGSMAGGTISGSVSAMTFTGEPSPGANEDIPSLDSNCAVCGRPTDPDRLTEDNGRMVCPDCVKGARSRIERPVGGADLVEFKAPVPAPPKRGGLITFGPGFFTGAAAAAILVGCQIYLTLIEKPQGTLQARTVNPAAPPTVAPAPPGDPASVGPTTNQGGVVAPATQEGVTSPAPTVEGSPPAVAMNTTPPPAAPTVTPAPAPTAPSPGAATPPPPTTAEAPGSIIFPNDDPGAPAAPTVVPPAPPAPGSATPPAPAPAPPAVASSDPFDQAIERLQAKDYNVAWQQFDALRRRYTARPVGANEALTPQQALAWEGTAAADIGRGNPEDARARLDTAFEHNVRTRSLVLNRAIATVLSKGVTFKQFDVAAGELKAYLQANANDEKAADIFAGLLAKASAFPNVSKQLEPHWAFLDTYYDQLAHNPEVAAAHPNQLKWGTDWLPAEEVRRYRLVRANPTSAEIFRGVTRATRDLEIAKAKALAAQQKLDQASAAGGGGDIVGLRGQLDLAQKNLDAAQKAYDAATQLYKLPRYPEKFEPVIPWSITAAPAAPGAGQ